MVGPMGIPLDPRAQPTRAPERIRPGAAVEVWCRSLNTWSVGFVALDVDHGGWRVMRRSDRAELPVRFPPEAIRVARARQG